MSDLRNAEGFSDLLTSFVNSRLVATISELRTAHSHSDLLLPPDLVFPALANEIKTFQKENQLELVQKAVPEGASDAEKTAIETANRQVTWQRAGAAWVLTDFVSRRPSSSKQAKAHLDPSELRGLFDRCDVIIAFELQGLTDVNAPLTTIESVMESLPLTGCAMLLDYIESRKMELLSSTTPLSPSRGKGPVLLRLGNELRRRLSKPAMHDTILAGRIAALLSGVFPLGERSGSNQEGRFNTDNKTFVEPDEGDNVEEEGREDDAKEPTEEPAETEADEGEKEAEDAEDTSKGKVKTPDESEDKKDAKAEQPKKELLLEERATPDARFYSLFWNVQQFFANPALLLEDQSVLDSKLLDGLEDPLGQSESGPLQEFRMATKRIIDLIAAVNEHESTLAGAAEKEMSAESEGVQRTVNGTEEMEVDGQDDERESFFPKYLTGRNILASEFRDSSFRRQVLVQFLIVLQYILEFNPRRKTKWEDSKNKALVKAFTLSEADVGWCSNTWRAILGLLREIPGPSSYVPSITQALRREQNWIQWKLDLCPPLQKDPMSEEQAAPHFQGLKRLEQKLPLYPHKLGSFALKQLWEDGIPPPRPGKRKRENDEGIEVEVDTDGLEELEFPPQALDFDGYMRKWSALEQQLDQRRSELEIPKGSERRENEMRRNAEVLTMREQRSSTINTKTQLVMLDNELSSLKSAEPSEDSDADAKEKHEAKIKSIQERKDALSAQLPSEIVKKKNGEILAAATSELERYSEAVKKEKADSKIATLTEQQYSHSWRALRLARQEHLRHLCKIPTDDLQLLVRTVEGKFDPKSLSVEPPKDEGEDPKPEAQEFKQEVTAESVPPKPLADKADGGDDQSIQKDGDVAMESASPNE